VAEPRLAPIARIAFAAVVLVACVGCQASSPAPSSQTPTAPSAATFSEDPSRLPQYRSHRLALTLPLPDGKEWRIDDHSRPELVATHAPTRSRLAVSVFGTEELVGRTQCEEKARARNLVPNDDGRTLRTVEDAVAITQQTFDTRVEVMLAVGGTPASPLGGRVMAFGGFLRKCYVFVYSTEVDSASDEAVLSSRLAFVRARVLGGMELQPFDAVPREGAAGPNIAPAH
jgi:hypothetical protein